MANKVLKTEGTTEILRLIRAALANKQDKLTIDSAVSDTSSNPVENSAIYDAIKDLVSVNLDGNDLTFTSYKGDTTTVTIPDIDNLYKDVTFDTTDHKLTFETVDGTTKDIDLSSLIDVYDVDDTDEIDMTLDSDNKISAEIKTASVKREKLAVDVTDELDTDRKDIDDLKDTISTMGNQQPADEGDIAIVPLLFGDDCVWRKIDTKDASGNYVDAAPAGYVFTGNRETVIGRMFNRIKVNVYTPGWIRIGICRGTGTDEYDGVARGFCKAGYDYNTTDTYPVSLLPDGDGSDTTCDGKPHTMLRKWLVCQWIASPGVHTFDIPDTTITSPCEYVFLEDRTGISGFAMNRSGSTVSGNGLDVASGVIPNAQSWPTAYVSATNFNSGSYAVSRNMLDASADIIYQITSRGPQYSSWCSLAPYTTTDSTISRNMATGWLNIGLYQRGSSGVISHAPVLENGLAKSVENCSLTDSLRGWTPDYEAQQELAKQQKEIYAIDLIVATPGELTMYKMSGITPETARVHAVYTLPLRAIGRQTIHLPEPVLLQEGEYLCFGGVTEAAMYYTGDVTDSTFSTSGSLNVGYKDTAQFVYHGGTDLGYNITNWSCFGDDATGIQNNNLPYSGVAGRLTHKGFNRWLGVKFVGGSQKFDFTDAEYVLKEEEMAGTDAEENYLNIALLARSGRHSKLEDKNISITGDSITTYRGTISTTNDFGGVTNAAGDNAIFYPNSASGAVNSPDQTWWGLLIKNNRARLIRNDAWSGSQVGGTDSTTSSTACASTIRTRMLNGTAAMSTANTAGKPRHPYGNPEVIFCMIGTNDLSGGRTVGAYSNTAPTDISTLLGAFQTMIARHKTYYPYAKLVYFMIPRGSTFPYPYTNGTTNYSISQMASEMEYIAHAMGAHFVPLNYFEGIDRTDSASQSYWTSTTGYTHPRIAGGQQFATTDRLHPNIMGHQLIANGLTRYVEENF